MEVAGFTKTFAIDQGTVLGMDQLFQALYNKPLNDPKRDGICTGLSMIWLARRMMYHNETPEQRMKGLHSAGGYRWGGKTQDIHLVAGTGGSNIIEQVKTMYDEALRVYVLRIVTSSITFAGYTSSDALGKTLAKVVTRSGEYCLYNFGLRTTTGDPGHMVASYSSHGTLGANRHFYLFDPNMGEYRISVSQVPKFLEAFVDAYCAAFEGVNYGLSFEVQRG